MIASPRTLANVPAIRRRVTDRTVVTRPAH
jgi:hypothetical protein